MTPGSVVGPTGVSHPGFHTEAILVMIPLVAMTCIGRVISGKFAFAGITAVLVQTMLVVPLHVHPGAEIGALRTTPEGSTSVTVVVHIDDAGPSFVTRST